jgi:hypothetical protein
MAKMMLDPERSTMQNPLAVAIHAARRARGMTERELAAHAGMSLGGLRAIERWGCPMSIEDFAKLWTILAEARPR